MNIRALKSHAFALLFSFILALTPQLSKAYEPSDYDPPEETEETMPFSQQAEDTLFVILLAIVICGPCVLLFRGKKSLNHRPSYFRKQTIRPNELLVTLGELRKRFAQVQDDRARDLIASIDWLAREIHELGLDDPKRSFKLEDIAGRVAGLVLLADPIIGQLEKHLSTLQQKLALTKNNADKQNALTALDGFFAKAIDNLKKAAEGKTHSHKIDGSELLTISRGIQIPPEAPNEH